MAESKRTKLTRVLVVGDHQFELEEAIRLSTSAKLHVEQALDSQWAIEQYDREPSSILILCHSRVETAHSFYMNFLMQSEKALDTPHQSILLCDGKETHNAYELCVNQYIDDYVVYKPLYDIYRVKLSIDQAIERLGFINYKRLMEQRLKKIMSHMTDVKNLIAHNIKRVGYLKQQSIDQDDSIRLTIEQGFSKLKHKLDEIAIHAPKSDRQELDKSYNEIKQKTLDESLNHHKEALEQNGGVDWIHEMLAQFGDVSDEIGNEIKTRDNKEDDEGRIKVLIVEDESLNQKMMDMILKGEGFETHIASDGLEALSIAQKWLPDVIIMDIRMPKMNGLKVTQKLKSKAEFANTIIIMLTAHSEKVVVSECLKAGAADFIVKPAKKDKLLERIYFFLSQE
ncbi:PleD family two-component system response regulator [Bermanella sp. R86510]|uniref:response regulator n=1 Tax=unclassified Bermanella TaxID=2627862 RepID=UPI0037CBBDE3